MTDDRSTDQIFDIFGLPPSKRECALITRGALLEGRILDQQKTIERLEQQLAEALLRKTAREDSGMIPVRGWKYFVT